jgi:hypothetical protein
MTPLDWMSIGCLAMISGAFYSIRRLNLYVVACAAILGCFLLFTFTSVRLAQGSDWFIASLGLALYGFGLLIVRVMLVRSVSLHLLATLGSESGDFFRSDIRGRLQDMHRFRLAQLSAQAITLTTFGRFASSVTALLYTVFRIKA